MKFPRINKTFLLDISYIMAFGLSLVTFITFLFAYFNNHVTRVVVNNYGEAHLEFVLLTFVVMPIIMYGLWFRYKEVIKT